MAGPEAGGGFDFQAEVYSYVMCHGLDERDLAWFEGTECVPAAVRLESGGAGDDVHVETRSGKCIEVQSKKGLTKDGRFWQSIHSLLTGLIGDGSLLGVLLVDGNSSGTIRDDLQNDLLRLSDGCEDGLKPITGEVLARAQGMRGYSITVFRRLRIIQLDLKPGSAGRQAASNLLRHILTSNSEIESCWSSLTEQGLDLITRRGRRTVDDVAGRVASKFNTIPSNRAAVTRGKFRHWVEESSRRFFVPGLGICLDIDKAWMRLRVPEKDPSQEQDRESLAQQIARYHEWERLALAESSGDGMEIEHVFRFCPRAVVMGGPGSGKSTLTKRIAWRLAAEGSVVWRIRLPVVLRIVRNGHTFRRALLEAAADGSGIATESLEYLDPPDLLLADGLDECGAANSEVAAELLKWSTGHPNCGVWVTTRPVGYQPGLFPEFRHCELLPLSKEAVQDHSRRLFDAVSGTDLTRAITLWCEFCCSIEAQLPSRRVATLAARNPLLLGFIVKLMVDGVELGASRGELYKQVVAILGDTPPADREGVPNVSRQQARHVLRIAGWLSITTPAQERDEVVESIVAWSATKPARPLLDHDGVSDCLTFWENQGLLERLSAGHRKATTFIHPSLAEFAAAELACSFDEAELRSWIRGARRDARWRQVILLAAGLGGVDRIANSLLELDDPNQPCSTEACLAAAAIAEATCEAATDGGARVIAALATRIASPIPLVSIEAAGSLLPLSSYMPNVIAEAVEGLCGHEQPWTSFGARTLLILTRPESLDFDRIAAWLLSTPGCDEFTTGSKNSQSIREMLLPHPDESELRHRQVELLAERLLELDKVRAFKTIAEFSRRPRVSYKMLEDIASLYKKHGAEDHLGDLHNPLAGSGHWSTIADWRSRERGMHEVIAKACLDATGQHRITGQPPNDELLNLAAIYQCLELGDTPAGEIRFLQDLALFDVLVEVVRLAIATASLDPCDVAREANIALDHLGSDNTPLYRIWLTKVPVERHWELAVAATPDVPKLERALVHRNSAIVWFAANALTQESFRDQAPGVFRRALETGGRATLCFVSQGAREVFGADAAAVLLDRLRRPIDDGSEFLYEALAKIADESNRGAIVEAIVDGISNQPAEVAQGAAKALWNLKPPPDGDFLCRIQAALSQWTERRSHCDKHGLDVKGQRQCPRCIVVSCSPRASLIATLEKMGALSLAEILQLLSDEPKERHDVVETATKLIRQRVEADPQVLGDLLLRISTGELPTKLLDELLTLPLEIKTEHAPKLKELLTSPNGRVRMAIVHAMPQGWLGNESATAAARLSLSDEDPSVRNAALQALRRLRNEC